MRSTGRFLNIKHVVCIFALDHEFVCALLTVNESAGWLPLSLTVELRKQTIQ